MTAGYKELYEAALEVLSLKEAGWTLWSTAPWALPRLPRVPYAKATPADYVWRQFVYGPKATQPVTAAQLTVLAAVRALVHDERLSQPADILSDNPIGGAGDAQTSRPPAKTCEGGPDKMSTLLHPVVER